MSARGKDHYTRYKTSPRTRSDTAARLAPATTQNASLNAPLLSGTPTTSFATPRHRRNPSPALPLSLRLSVSAHLAARRRLDAAKAPATSGARGHGLGNHIWQVGRGPVLVERLAPHNATYPSAAPGKVHRRRRLLFLAKDPCASMQERHRLLLLATPRYRRNDPCASKASKVQQICGQKGIVEESCAPFPQLPGGPLHVGAPAALRAGTKGERDAKA